MSTKYIKSKYYPLSLLRAELATRGYTVLELPLSVPYIEIIAPNGKPWLTKRTVAMYPFISLAAKQISINKRLAYDFATCLSVATPRSMSAPFSKKDVTDFARTHSPVIVKPNNSSGSKGLKLNITSPEALADAIEAAQDYSQEILVQEQFVGEEVRFTIVGGKVVSVMLRQVPQVVGDGKHSVKELIDRENAFRQEHLQLEYLPYPQLTEAIIPKHFFNDTSIPVAEKVIKLSNSTMVSGGASVYDIRDTIHASYVDTALTLAKALNPDFMVVDMMIKDYKTAQNDNNYIFVEFNTAPSLRLYYGLRGGEVCDIVKLLADQLDSWSKLA